MIDDQTCWAVLLSHCSTWPNWQGRLAVAAHCAMRMALAVQHIIYVCGYVCCVCPYVCPFTCGIAWSSFSRRFCSSSSAHTRCLPAAATSSSLHKRSQVVTGDCSHSGQNRIGGSAAMCLIVRCEVVLYVAGRWAPALQWRSLNNLCWLDWLTTDHWHPNARSKPRRCQCILGGNAQQQGLTMHVATALAAVLPSLTAVLL